MYKHRANLSQLLKKCRDVIQKHTTTMHNMRRYIIVDNHSKAAKNVTYVSNMNPAFTIAIIICYLQGTDKILLHVAKLPLIPPVIHVSRRSY